MKLWRLLTITLPLTSLTGCFVEDWALLHPQTQRLTAPDAHRLTIPFGQGFLEAWVQASPGALAHTPEAFALDFNGNGTRSEQVIGTRARLWGAHAVEVWSVNYPGYGGSTGPAHVSDLASMAETAYAAIVKAAGQRRVFLTGNSLGTTLVLHAATRSPTAAGIILQDPPPLRQLIIGEHSWWNLGILARFVASLVPEELDSIANAAKSRIPVVFAQAENDQTVPVPYQNQIFSAYAGPKKLIRKTGGSHRDPLDAENYIELPQAVDWLWTHGPVDSTSVTGRVGLLEPRPSPLSSESITSK